MKVRVILLAAVSAVGAAALTQWLSNAGFSQDTLMLVLATCAALIVLLEIGSDRLATWRRKNRSPFWIGVAVVGAMLITLAVRAAVHPFEDATTDEASGGMYLPIRSYFGKAIRDGDGLREMYRNASTDKHVRGQITGWRQMTQIYVERYFGAVEELRYRQVQYGGDDPSELLRSMDRELGT